MIDLTREQRELFKRTSVDKQLVIPFSDGIVADITNSNIISESMQLSEVLCDEEQIHFGLINSAQFEVTVAKIDSDIKGKEIKPYLAVSGIQIPLGVFYITDVQKVQDKVYKKLVAMDNVNKLDVSVKDWYEKVSFPISIRDFRDSLFEYLGLEQIETTLNIDDLIVEDNIEVDLNGKQIMSQICELEGCFGRFNRYGKFEYLKLSSSKEDAYSLNHTPSILRNDIVCDNYDTTPINGVRFYGTNGEFSQFGGTSNIYVIQSNFIINNKSTEELQQIASDFLATVGNITYRPCNIQMMGQPYLELGDMVSVDGYTDNIITYILKRTMSGTQSLKDVLDIKGQEYLDIDTNSIVSQLLNLNRNDKQMKIDISATKEGLSLKVSKDDVISAINQSPEKIQIDAKNINLNGLVTANENFKILEDGSVDAKDGKFSGKLILENGTLYSIHPADGAHDEPFETPIMYWTTEADATMLTLTPVRLNSVEFSGTHVQLTPDYNAQKVIISNGNFKGDINLDGDITLNGVSLNNSLSNHIKGVDIGYGYYGLSKNGDDQSFLRTTKNGLIPYEPNKNGSGYIGTQQWSFSEGWFKRINATDFYVTTINSQYLYASNIELISATPFIDFHFNNSTKDYTSRIIEWNAGALTVYNTISNGSDERLKKDIVKIDNKYSKLLELIDAKEYRFKKGDAILNLGFIAQDVDKALDEIGITDKPLVSQDGSDDGILALDYNGFIPIMWQILKEQQKQIEELKNK